MSLQTITASGEILNHTELGQAIQAFSNSEQAFQVLTDNGLDCGFMDGCCWPLAIALQQQFGGELSVVFCESNRHTAQPDHIVLKLPFDYRASEFAYADADGLATESELINKMHTLEQRQGEVKVMTMREFESKYGQIEQDLIFDYHEIDLSAQLFDSLRDFYHQPKTRSIGL